MVVDPELLLKIIHHILVQLKCLGQNIRLIDGFDPNTALAIVITPGFWLLKPAVADQTSSA